MLLCIACFADFAGNTQVKMMKIAATTVFRIAVLATILWVVLTDSRPGPATPDFEKWKDLLKNISESKGAGECTQASFGYFTIQNMQVKILGLITHNTLYSNMCSYTKCHIIPMRSGVTTCLSFVFGVFLISLGVCDQDVHTI